MKAVCSHCRVLGGSVVENNGRELGKHMECHHKQTELISALVKWSDKISSVEENISNEINRTAGRSTAGKCTRTAGVFLANACCKILRDAKTIGKWVWCKKCGQRVIIFTKAGSLFSLHAIDHARIHLGKILFNCPYCERGCQTISAMRQHVKRLHGRSYLVKKYQQEKSAASTMAVLDMVKECFQDDDDKETQATKLSSVQRLLERKHRMMDILQNGRGNIHCKICGKETRQNVRGKFYEWKHPMDHVRLHLDKPMFRCKLCDHNAHTYCTIRKHIRTKHCISVEGQYEDYSDQFHHELMQMIYKCYGQV